MACTCSVHRSWIKHKLAGAGKSMNIRQHVSLSVPAVVYGLLRQSCRHDCQSSDCACQSRRLRLPVLAAGDCQCCRRVSCLYGDCIRQFGHRDSAAPGLWPIRVAVAASSATRDRQFGATEATVAASSSAAVSRAKLAKSRARSLADDEAVGGQIQKAQHRWVRKQ